MAKTKSARKNTPTDSAAAVDEFMTTLKHPHKDAIAEIRRVIRSADPSISEGVKWNAPSFRTSEYFATTHLRDKKGIALIFHLGAKVRETAKPDIDDPRKLLTWLAKDRAMASFAGLEDLRARASALQGIVRQWIKHV